MIMHKNGQKICTRINFDMKASDIDQDEVIDNDHKNINHRVDNRDEKNIYDSKVLNRNLNETPDDYILEEDKKENDTNRNFSEEGIDCSNDLDDGDGSDMERNEVQLEATLENASFEKAAPLKSLRDSIEGKGAKDILKLFKKEWLSSKDLDVSIPRLTSLAFSFAFLSWILRLFDF